MRIRTRFPAAWPQRPAAPVSDAQLTLLLRQYFDDLTSQPIPAALSKLIDDWDSGFDGGQGARPPSTTRWPGHRQS